MMSTGTQDRIGKYVLRQHLASGGMGEVFVARAEGPAGFSKTVALKRILPQLALDPTFVEMFLNEARLAAMLDHPNIVQIFELGEHDGSYFLAMEYIHGKSLRAIQRRLWDRGERVPWQITLRVASLALRALDYAHAFRAESGELLGVIHRDISPDNLLVGFNGVVKLMDFGIAKAAAGATTTSPGTVKGKYAYMAPEQLNASVPLDGRADIYSMGVLLYEMLTGKRPFAADSEVALIRAVLSDAPAPPSTRVTGLPAGLDTVVLRALAKDRDLRFGSAAEMANVLDGHLASEEGAVSSLALARFLQALFPEDSERSDMRGSSLAVPVARTPASSLISTQTKPLPARPASIDVDLDLDAEVSAVLPARRRWPLVLALVGVVAAGGLGAVAVFSRAKASSTPVHDPAPMVDIATRATAAKSPPAPALPPTPAGNPPHPTVPLAGAPVTPATAVAAVAKPVSTHGKVAFRVNPWAEVFWKGVSLGITPIDPVTVPVGRQTFTLRNDQLHKEQTVSVRVRPDGTTVLRSDLME